MSGPASAPQQPSLADFLPDELPQILGAHGIRVDELQGRRIFAAAVDRWDLGTARGIPQATLRRIEDQFAHPALQVSDRQVSPTDGFVKYLFRLEDGAEIEAVRIPLPCEPPDTPEGADARRAVTGTWRGKEKKYVVCVSSQVGCALGCTFCATATLGFRRQLRPSEIIAQVQAIRAEADRPVRGVVFMGMGEPFLNYDAVVKAARILSHPAGLAIHAGDISISTAGIVPAIERYTAEGHKFRLAISLSSALPERRRQIMPIEKKYSTASLVEAIRNHARMRGGRVTVAYVLIGGPEGNCRPEDARALGDLFRDVPIRLDLIDVNGSVGGFLPPSASELKAFRDALDVTLRQPVARRYSGGKDIEAACGMLAARRPVETSVARFQASN